MHYLVMPIGSAGDVHPLMGLACELHARGNRVTLATSGYFEDLAKRAGLDFEAIGTREEFLKGVANPDLWHPVKGFRYIFDHLLKEHIATQYDLIEKHHSSGPLVVLTNCFGMGAISAQEKLGVPVVSVHLQPVLLWSDIAPPQLPNMIGPRWFRRWLFRFGQSQFIDPCVTPFLNAFRATKGLPPVRRVMQWWHSKSLILCLFPRWYCEPQVDWPSPLEQVDFPLWDERTVGHSASQGNDSPGELDQRLSDFLKNGAPPIAMTPGSANIFGKKFFEAGIEACRRNGLRAILLTRFTDQLPEDLPETVLHVPFVPLSLLLPHCAGFIHHGGIGSASQALAAGVPQLIWPLAHDQFDNANRLKRLGVAESILPRKFKPHRVAASLRRLTSSSEVASCCREIAAKIEPARGIQQAADVLRSRFE